MACKKPNRPTVVVRNVLLSKQFELLLGLRSDTLLWELPGGKVEDETVAQAGVREQAEETGIDLGENYVLLGFADSASIKHPDRRFVELFLLWSEWDGFARTEEDNHLIWRWCGVDDLPPEAKLMPSTRFFVERLLPHYLQNAQAVSGEEEEPEGSEELEPAVPMTDFSR